jgi:hypothetical protein
LQKAKDAIAKNPEGFATAVKKAQSEAATMEGNLTDQEKTAFAFRNFNPVVKDLAVSGRLSELLEHKTEAAKTYAFNLKNEVSGDNWYYKVTADQGAETGTLEIAPGVVHTAKSLEYFDGGVATHDVSSTITPAKVKLGPDGKVTGVISKGTIQTESKEGSDPIQPPETEHAIEEPSAATSNASSSTQPGVRGESGDTTVGGAGLRESRQEAPRQETAKAATQAEKVTDLYQNLLACYRKK